MTAYMFVWCTILTTDRDGRDPPRDRQRLSTAVVRAVAAAAGRPATAPGFVLADAIDPEALDDLFAGGGEWSVEFRIEKWTVTVTHRGTVDVRPAER